MSEVCERHGRIRCGECAYIEELKERLTEQELEIERLKTERNKYRDEAVNERELTESIVAERDQLIIDNERLTEQLKQVIEALENISNMEYSVYHNHTHTLSDAKRIARQTLQSIKGGETDATQTSD